MAHGIQAVVPCERIGVSVIGLEVPHAHIHLIPIESVSDINFSKAKMQLDKDEMVRLASQISAAVRL